MKKEKQFIILGILFIGALVGSRITAQNVPDTIHPLSELVITATKFPKPRLETGKTIYVIDSETIERSAGKNLSQILNEQAGIDINGANSSPGKDKSVYLQGALGQYTLILMDGIPLTDPSGIGGAFDLRLIALDQIERIEILKGSQSTLYGSDAIAGVINILSKQNENRNIGGHALLSYGSFQSIKGNIGIQGNTKWLDYRAAYTHDETAGISEAKEETSTADFDKDGFQQNAFQVELGVKPSENFKINSSLQYSDFKGDYDAGSFADDKEARYDSKIIRLGLGGKYKLRKGSLEGQFTRLETDRKFKSAFGIYPYKGFAHTGELFLNQDLNKYLQLAAGLQLQDLKMNDDQAVLKNPSIQMYSAFVSGYLRNLSGFSAELGGRFNTHSEFGNAFTFGIHPSYLIDQQLKIVANYSTGFKAPTLNELYGQFGANEDLKPQKSRHAEIGLQYFSLDQTVEIRVSLFKRRIKNVIIYGNPGYINLDKQSDHGIELETKIRLSPKLTAQAFYTFISGEVSTKDFANRDTSFNNLIRRPKHTMGASIKYQVTKQFFTTIYVKSVGERKDTYFDPNTFNSSSVDLSPYQLLNVYLEYQLLKNKLRLFLDAKNLLNQDYMEVYGYNVQRINFNTGLSFRF